MLFDNIFGKDCGDMPTNELGFIVGDQRLWAAKPTNYVSLDESFHTDFFSR